MTAPLILQTFSLVALVVMLVVTMQMDDLPQSPAFNLMVTAVLFIVIGYLLQLLYTVPQVVFIARAFQLIGILFAYPLSLYCTWMTHGLKMRGYFHVFLLLIPILSILPLLDVDSSLGLVSFDMLWTRDHATHVATGSVGYSMVVYYGYPCLCWLVNCFLLARGVLHGKKNDLPLSVVSLIANIAPPFAAILYYATRSSENTFNPYSAVLALCCVACGIASLPSRTGNWASYARELALQNSREGYALFDASGRYVESNSFVKRLFPVLQSINGAVPLNRLPELQQLTDATSQLPPGHSRVVTIDGNRLRVSGIQVEYGGKYVGLCVQLQDETKLDKLKKDMDKIEITDYTTGFLNERTFQRIFERDYHIALRIGLPACVLALAIDKLDDVQTRYGDDCVKYTVQSVSLMIRARLRKTDLICHADDGSFLIFLPASHFDDALDIAEAFRQVVQHGRYEYESVPLTPTVSVGLASLDTARHIEPERMLVEARAAMFTAQNTGGNRVCVGGPK